MHLLQYSTEYGNTAWLERGVPVPGTYSMKKTQKMPGREDNKKRWCARLIVLGLLQEGADFGQTVRFLFFLYPPAGGEK